MNYASNILTYLSRSDDFSEVLLAPGAPAVAKKARAFDIVISSILNPQDIRETLSTFHSHTRQSAATPISAHGVFSFGMPNLGRFRVHYFTQRGSYVVSVRKVPMAVPDLQTILANPATVQALDETTAGAEGGLLFIISTAADWNVEFAYALLKRIGETEGKIIYILEEDLSFLVKHQKSVIIQSEVDTDISSLEEGIRNGVLLAPDIMYVRNPRSKEEIVGLMQAAEGGTLVIASVIALNEKVLLLDMESRLGDFYDNFCALLRKIVKVVRAAPGKVSAEIIQMPWGKEPARSGVLSPGA
jgi:twitching motility protein PilT